MLPRSSLRFGRSATPCALAIALLLGGLASASHSQQAPTPRPFAPGVLTTIPPSLEPADTVSTHDLVEIRSNQALQWNPEYLAASDTLFGLSADVKFRREIWCLEFSFKPLRMIEVDIPQPAGGTQRKLVWYLVYRVRNTGKTLRPVEGEGHIYSAEPGTGGSVRFIPQFVLESQDRPPDGARVNKSYLDRVIPAAVAAISQREARGRKLLNSVEISQQPIAVSGERIDRGVWGVATWTDVDPRIDFFSVFVGGLTNAYRWEDIPGAYQAGDPPGKGRRFLRKTLQLNFWRPGDELLQNERELRFGVPIGKADIFGVPEGLDYQWVFR